jgi:WD40 repeat protein
VPGRQRTQPRLPSPRPPGPIVLYPGVFAAAKARLIEGGAAALVGPSGFGKSALAQQLLRDPEIEAAFGDSVYWLGIGRDLQAAELAKRLNDVTKLAGGSDCDLTDPVLAAQFLAGRIGAGALLVFDDIWQESWPDILRFVTDSAAVLVTARESIALPELVESFELTTPPIDLGAQVLATAVPQLDPLDCERISALTKGRPFLLALVTAQLQLEAKAGRPAREAFDDLLRRVAGATDFDGMVESVGRPGATLTAESCVAFSVDRLSDPLAECLNHLVLFRSDQDVPLPVLATSWGVTEARARTIAYELQNRSLVTSVLYRDGGYVVRTHDILLDYLRTKLSAEVQRDAHRTLIHRLVGLAPEAAEAADYATARLYDAVATSPYLGENLFWHLGAFLDPAALERIATDPEYLGAKVAAAGVGECLADLTLVTAQGPGGAPSARTQSIMGFVPSLRHLRDRRSATASIRSFLGETGGAPHEFGYERIIALDETPGATELRGSILCCALNADQTQVLIATSEGIVAVLDAADLRPLHRFRLAGGWARACAFVPGGFAVGSDDGLIRVYEGTGRKLTSVFAGHLGEIRSLAVSADGTWLASGSDDRTVRQWDLKTGLMLRVFLGHDDRVRSVAIAPDGASIVSGSDDRSIRQWDVATGELRRTRLGHTDRVRGVAIAPDGQTVASVSDDGTVRCWSHDDFRILGSHGCVVRDVDFTADGTAVITAGAHDNLLRVWPVDGDPAGQRVLTGHRSWVMCCRTGRSEAGGPDWAVSGSDDGTVRRWRLSDGTETDRIEGRNEWAFAVTAGPERAGTSVGVVLSAGVAGGGSGTEIVRLGSGCRGLAAVPGGDLLAGTDDGRLTRIRPDGTTSSLTLSGHSVRRVHRIDATGEYVSCCHAGSIYVVAVPPSGPPTLVDTIRTGRGSVYEAKAIPGTDLVVSAHETGEICVHSRRGELVSAVPAHRGPALAVDVSASGALVASGGDDGNVRLLRCDQGTLTDLGVVARHDDWVSQVVFGPDAATVVSGSDDHTLRSTDLVARAERAGLAFEQPLYALAWIEPGRALVVGGGAGVYRVHGI